MRPLLTPLHLPGQDPFQVTGSHYSMLIVQSGSLISIKVFWPFDLQIYPLAQESTFNFSVRSDPKYEYEDSARGTVATQSLLGAGSSSNVSSTLGVSVLVRKNRHSPIMNLGTLKKVGEVRVCV